MDSENKDEKPKITEYCYPKLPQTKSGKPTLTDINQLFDNVRLVTVPDGVVLAEIDRRIRTITIIGFITTSPKRQKNGQIHTGVRTIAPGEIPKYKESVIRRFVTPEDKLAHVQVVCL